MNRLKYDSCTYDKELMQSTAPFNYVLDPVKYENCNKCRMQLGIVGGTAVSHIHGNLVDLENDLRGQNRPATRCASYKYAPRSDFTLQGKEYIKPVCHPTIDTRLQHLQPCQMVRHPEVPLPQYPTQFSCQNPYQPL